MESTLGVNILMNFKDAYESMSREAAHASLRGLPMILAGIAFWVIAGIAGIVFDDLAVWVYVYGIGLVFPVGLLVGKVMKADMLAATNPLFKVAGMVGGMQLLFVPLVVLVLMVLPAWLPLAVGVLTGAHFLPLAVLYRSKAYVVLSIGTVATATLTGWLLQPHAFVITPFAVAAVYFVTCILLHFEHHRNQP